MGVIFTVFGFDFVFGGGWKRSLISDVLSFQKTTGMSSTAFSRKKKVVNNRELILFGVTVD